MPGSVLISTEDINAKFAFAENPIVVKATNLEFDGLFRTVVIEVVTFESGLSSNKRTYTFEVNADGLSISDTVSCDISTAIRSALAKYKYAPEDVQEETPFNYPFVIFRISAWLKEFYKGGLDLGTVTEASGVLPDGTPTNTFYAYPGGVTDMERWVGDSEINIKSIPTSFTTKPAGEIFSSGQIIVNTWYDEGKGGVVSVFEEVVGGVIDQRKRDTILFVNSRGVYETISVLPAEREEYEINSEVYSIVGTTTYRPSPYITTRKEGGGAVWEMSSGYVNKDWAQWFTREFLMAKHYWLRRDGKWLPIVVTPEKESVMTYNKTDPSLIAVNFTAQAAIRG